MSAIAEVETVPDVIEATVNYVQNNGEKLFTYTGAPGGERQAPAAAATIRAR